MKLYKKRKKKNLVKMKLPCQNFKNLFGTKKTKGQLDVSIKGNFKAGDWSQAVTFLNIPSQYDGM